MADPTSVMSRLGNPLTTVRGRSTVLSTVAVFVTLVIGSLVLLFVFRSNLQSNLDQTLELQAQDRARLISEGTDPTELTAPIQEESMVWIGTLSGDVVASGGGIHPLENPIPDVLNQVVSATFNAEERHPDQVEVERMSLRLASATTSDGNLVVLTAAETEIISKAVNQLAVLFAIAVPILSAVVAFLAWHTVGRALAPVDRIRRRAEEVSGTNLSERVPVPPGQDEIADLAITMNEMLDRLESHRDSLRQFTANASHELKSPIANLRMLAETTRSSDPAWEGTRDRLVSESDRLRDLVDNLLFLAAHSEAGAPTITGPVDLDDLLFDEAEVLAATRGFAVDVGGIAPVTIDGVKADLRRLVRNLVDNAARHANSRVALSTESSPDHITMTVSDDGPGIAEKDREAVFERFTRLDEARDREAGGSGLGLAIVKQIVEDHDGSIAVGDASLGGAEVVVRFPSST